MAGRIALRIVFALWALNALLPVFAMIQRSLTPGGHFSFSAYTRLFFGAREWALLESSLGLALATAVVTGLLGLALSIFLARTDMPWRKALSFLFVLPLLLPPTILAYGWSALLERDSLLGKICGASGNALLFSPGGGVLVLAASFLPLILLFTMTSLLSANPRLEEAARLSARTPRILFAVTIPQAAPAFLTACLLVFCLALGEMGAPTFLRINVFAVESLAQFSAFYDFSSATAAAMPLLLVTLLAFWGFHILRSDRVAVLQPTPTSGGPVRIRLGHLRPWLSLLVAFLWIAVAGLPLLALVFHSLDLSAFAEALTRGGASLGRSLLYASLAASVILFFGFLTGYGRTTRTLGYWAEAIPLFLFALPGSVLGIGLISLWNRPATGTIYGSPMMLLLGLLAQYMVLGVWTTKATLAFIPRSMEEAAAIAGASWTARLTHITVPLSRKGLLAAWLLAFLFCLRDTGLALVVYPPGRETLPVRLFTLMANGRPALISALCILILLSAAVPFAVLALLFAKGRS
jgi:iron(III) transport system permease protein